MLQNKRVHFQNLGLVDYRQAWDYQEELFAETVQVKIRNRALPPDQQQVTRNYLLFCEHPHVYTLGKSGDPAHLLLSEAELREYGASYYPINRGGDITYHGPGQLVCYPILDLDNFFTDIHLYLRTLEEAVIRTLADYGLRAGRIPGLTGVWLSGAQMDESGNFQQVTEADKPRKICAMGVKASRWVTMHGLALNVNTDLTYFGHIIPCGIDDKDVTSLARELGRQQNVSEVGERLRGHLETLFGMELLVDEQLFSGSHRS